MDDAGDALCPSDLLNAAVEQFHGDEEGGLSQLSALLESWPFDPRLHFLQGSVLAGLQRYDEGRRAMARAVEIAPDYALARFQLGFLDLTSGRPRDAIAVWTPLMGLAPDDPFRLFAEGLANMIGDRVPAARELLRRGIARNPEHPLVNAHMQLILDEMDGLGDRDRVMPPAGESPESVPPPPPREEGAHGSPASAVDLLLRQARFRDGGNTRH